MKVGRGRTAPRPSAGRFDAMIYIHRHLHPLQPAHFIERPHRFCVIASLASTGERVECHLADPGRLKALLVPGAVVHVSGPFGGARKLPYSAVLVESGGVCVSLATALPNQLFEALLRAGSFPGLMIPERLEAVEREVKVGGSRLDFRIHDDEGPCLVEVKCVTMLGEGGWGRFPDAPSERARRHLGELIEVAGRGGRAAVVFVTGRGDVARIGAAADVDPAFAGLLAEAEAAGVSLLGLRLCFDEVGARDPVAIPVISGPP